MGALAFLFFCLAGYFWRVSAKRKKELEVQAKDLADYRKLTGVQETIASLNGDIVRMKTAVSKKKAEHDELLEQLSHAEKEKKAEHDKLLEQIRHAEKVLESFEQDAAGRQDVYETLQDTGFYAPLYDFGTAQEYKGELERIREQQKQLVKYQEVIQKMKSWHVEGNAKASEKMIDSIGKLMLRAFNGECDAIIAKVKFGNVTTFQDKIASSAQAINKLTDMWGLQISDRYAQLKITELRLVYEYQEKIEQEREEQRRIKEQMKEEERAQKELEKARQDAEKEEMRYKEALEKAQKEVNEASGAITAELAAKIAALQQQLEEAQQRTDRAISQAQLTKSGYIYVISNIGSFGEDVYKIGMTRRLEPLDRVKELGDASVPFAFDVHALIYSENAPAMENSLHKLFDKKRVNRINERREFFRVTLLEIEQAVYSITEKATFTHTALAKEYRETQSILEKENHLFFEKKTYLNQAV
jgi:hypothetical protein